MSRIPVKYPQHILEAMEKDKPSKDPAYWAKKGCRDCYGRGVMGKVTQALKGNNKIVNEQLCACVKKAFIIWQEQWVEDHKDQVVVPVPEVSALNSDLQSSVIEERIERLDTMCQSLKEEIKELKSKRDEIPVTMGLVGLNDLILAAQQAVEKAKEEIADVLHEADLLDSRASELYTEVKTLRHQAEVLRTVDRANKQLVLEQRQEELRVREQDLAQGQERCTREQRKIHKRIRELEDKVDRFEDRRHRVLKECGLDPVITQKL